MKRFSNWLTDLIRTKSAFRFETLAWFIALSASLFFYNNCSQHKFAFKRTEGFNDGQGTGSPQQAATGNLVIEQNREYVNRLDVQLDINSTDDSEMYITNDSTCKTGGVWEKYSATRPWKLSRANQKVSVYAKFRNSDAMVSECEGDSIIEDDVPPATQYTLTPPSITNVTQSNFSFIGTDNISGVAYFECSDSSNGTFQKCATPLSKNRSVDGGKSLIIRAVDKAGNTSDPGAYSWLLDTNKPTVALNSQPSKISGSAIAEFRFSGEDGLSGIDRLECSLDNTSLTACNDGKANFNGLSEGNHTFRAVAVDRAQNRSDILTYGFKIDLTMPSVTITKGPSIFSNSKNAAFEFFGKDGNDTLTNFQCQIDGSVFTKCGSGQSYSNLSEAAHTFAVQGIDDAGNKSGIAEYKWTVDVTAPVVTLVERPVPFTNDKTANFRFEIIEMGSGIQNRNCLIDGKAIGCDNNSAISTNLGEGQHNFSVTVTDRAGNNSNGITHTWLIDLTAPKVTITKGPLALVNQTTAEFAYSSDEANVTFECRIDSEAFAACATPKSIANIREGAHTFEVIAIDRVGNRSLSPAIHKWVIDITGPSITFTSKPSDHKSNVPATVAFKVEDDYSAVSSVSCGLDGVMTGCNAINSVTLNGLTPGSHTYTVVAADELGNRTSGSYTWQVQDYLKAQAEIFNIQAAMKNVDVLFVVDNSGSMIEEQTNLNQKIDGFISKIQHLNYQIAVTSTDAYHSYNGDGRLISFGSGKPIIDPKDTNPQKLLGDGIMSLGLHGHGDERGIYTTYRSIERAVASQAPHNQFFRTTSALAVVLISDEDECSTGCDTSRTKDDPTNLINFVKSTYGAGKIFSFNSIIKRPGDTHCAVADKYGEAYAELSTKTGGVIGDICASDYTNMLTNIGYMVAGLVRSLTLSCAPVDTNNDGIADVTVERMNGTTAQPLGIGFKVSGKLISFDADLPEGSQLRINYSCPN